MVQTMAIEVCMINPELDGVDHINVYSKGRTSLGRFLTNFAYSPITTEDGPFNSIEGYWYWLGTNHPGKDKLRTTYGFKAKQLGRELGALDWQSSDDFKRKILAAIRIKLTTNPEILIQLQNTTVPLLHYYNYSGKVVEPKDGKWILDYLNSFRLEAK